MASIKHKVFNGWVVEMVKVSGGTAKLRLVSGDVVSYFDMPAAQYLEEQVTWPELLFTAQEPTLAEQVTASHAAKGARLDNRLAFRPHKKPDPALVAATARLRHK